MPQDGYDLAAILNSFKLPEGQLEFSFEELYKATSMSKTVSRPALPPGAVPNACHSSFPQRCWYSCARDAVTALLSQPCPWRCLYNCVPGAVFTAVSPALSLQQFSQALSL